ncbi:MAG TPA: DUF5011 domain-containing protein [Bacteroidales bacterium]|nr:DUF5011 domain-containing protein [Bacteroidales bacterium]HRZ49034.1 DUF5011 domain-containing protein [Bacteroidales bacterium]
MKKLSVILGVVAAMLMVFSACETDDLVNPVITLTGADTIEIVLNDAAGFTDPGATATDDKDGDLTAQIIKTGTVDVAKIGSYELTYSVSDNAGNQATVKRIVNVIVEQATYAGIWNVTEVITGSNPDPNWVYSATVAASGTDVMKLIITNFGGFANFNANITFDKFGNFTIPNQAVIGAPEAATIEGEGTSTTSDDGTTLTINYKVEWATSGTDHSAGTWTKAK